MTDWGDEGQKAASRWAEFEAAWIKERNLPGPEAIKVDRAAMYAAFSVALKREFSEQVAARKVAP